MLKQPLITLGVSCYNAEETIARAVESALSQSWSNKEIIVVDDASEDDSVAIIRELIRRHENIKLYVNKNNLGIAAVRNKIIKYSNGGFIAFFDDDDDSDINRIEFQYKRIKDYKKKWKVENSIICHTARKVVYMDGTSSIEETVGCNTKRMSPNGARVASNILIGTNLVDAYGSMATCSQMADIKTYRDIGGFDENLRRQEDTELNIRLAILGCHFIGISKPLVTQYLTAREDKNIQIEEDSTIYLLEKHKTFIEMRSSFSFINKWANLKFLVYRKKYVKFLIYFLILFFKYPLLTTKRLILSLPNFKKNKKYFSDNR